MIGINGVIGEISFICQKWFNRQGQSTARGPNPAGSFILDRRISSTCCKTFFLLQEVFKSCKKTCCKRHVASVARDMSKVARDMLQETCQKTCCKKYSKNTFFQKIFFQEKFFKNFFLFQITVFFSKHFFFQFFM